MIQQHKNHRHRLRRTYNNMSEKRLGFQHFVLCAPTLCYSNASFVGSLIAFLLHFFPSFSRLNEVRNAKIKTKVQKPTATSQMRKKEEKEMLKGATRSY